MMQGERKKSTHTYTYTDRHTHTHPTHTCTHSPVHTHADTYTHTYTHTSHPHTRLSFLNFIYTACTHVASIHTQARTRMIKRTNDLAYINNEVQHRNCIVIASKDMCCSCLSSARQRNDAGREKEKHAETIIGTTTTTHTHSHTHKHSCTHTHANIRSHTRRAPM